MTPHGGSGLAASAVRWYYQLVDEQEVDGLLTLFAADAVYRRPGYEPLVGATALERFYRSRRVISSGRHTITELVAEGGKVAVRGGFTGLLKSGERVEVEFADFFTVNRDGLFASRDTFFFTPAV